MIIEKKLTRRILAHKSERENYSRNRWTVTCGISRVFYSLGLRGSAENEMLLGKATLPL